MKYSGSDKMANDLILDIDFDISEAEAKQRKLNAQWEQQKVKIENMKKSIADANSAIDKMKSEQTALKEKWRETAQEAGNLEHIIDKMQSFKAEPEEWIKYGSLENAQKKLKEYNQILNECNAQYDKVTATIIKKEAEISKTNALLVYEQGNLDMIGTKILKNTGEVEEQTEKVEAETEKVEHQGRSWKKVNQHLKTNRSALDKNLKRIKELAKSALIFSVLTKVLTSMRNSVGEIFGKDKEIAQYWAQLKNNLTVIMTTISQSLKPYITWILDKIIYMTEIIQGLLSRALGKSTKEMQQMADNMKDTADNTKKAANEAKKATASFDTLQTATNQTAASDSSGSAGSINTSNMTNLDTSQYDEIIKKLKTILNYVVVIGAGFIAWKITKFLSDLGFVNDKIKVFAGILMTILGTVMFIQSYSDAWVNGINWDNFGELIGSLSLIVGGLGLAFGIVGSAIGFIIGGLALVVLGIKDMIENGINGKNIMTLNVGAISTAFGILLLKTKSVGGALTSLFSPTGLLIMGIAILVEGIAYLAQNWDKLSPAQRTITILSGLAAALTAAAVAVALFHTSWSIGVAAAAIAGGIALLAGTYLFKKANQKGISTDLSSSGTAPNSISQYAKYANMSSPIPALATGAVIPGGKPFMAMLGDQRAGQTNIEAPLDTIVEAVKLAIGEPKFTVEAKGSWAQFIKMLALEIKQEQNRSSVF